MTLEMILAQPVVTRLGWALAHFVWQGALAGGIAALALAAMRRNSANARYLAACAALCVMAALPVYTFVTLETEPAPAAGLGATAFSQGAAGEEMAAGDATRVSTQVDAQARPAALSQREPRTPGGGAANSSGASDKPWYAAYGIGQLTLIVGRFAPWLAVAWGACVLALSARFLGGWARVRRISTGALELAEADLAERCERMRERVKVTRPVRFLRSAIAEVPMVIGWMKPVILLPASVMTSLPAEQLEAIIAHELAHVRRWDYLVNLIQTAVETLLFYHPAVWWVSRRIRAEREHAADDAAAEACGNRLIYARALAGLEETRTGHGRLAVAASGGTLMERIRRIAGAPSPREGSATGWLGAVIVISIVAFAFACALPSREAAKDRFPASGKAADGEARSSDAEQSSTHSSVRRWTHEGQFELDKKLLVRLAAGTRAAPTLVRVNYVQFAVADGQLTAYVRYYNVTAADAKFRIGVAITDQAGKVLGRDEAVIESHYISIGINGMSDYMISLAVGGQKDIPAARRFQLYVEEAPDDAGVNAKFVDTHGQLDKDSAALKGSLTLEVEAVSADGARVDYPVLFQLWRRTEHPRELDCWYRYCFTQTWEDAASNAVWEPVGASQSGSPVRWTDLASGQYLVTAAQASSVTGAQVRFGPMGASGVIILDGSTTATPRVELGGDATLLVKAVDEATGKPVDGVDLNILRADGLPPAVTRMERGGEGETRCGYLRAGKYYVEAHRGFWWDTVEYFADEKAAVEVVAGKENVLTVRLKAVKHSFEPTSGGDAKETERGAVPAGRTALNEAAKGAYVATLANGVTVDVIGVSHHPSKDQRWWKPDGSAIIEAPYDCPNISSSITGYQAREAAVRLSGRGADSAAFKAGPGGASWPAERDGKKIEGMIGLVAHFKNGERTGTLRIGAAAGPWRTVQPLERAEIGAAVGPEGEFHYSISAWPNDGITADVVTDRGRNEDLRVVAVDMTGQVREGRRSIDMAGDMMQVVTEFSGISFDDVRQLQYQVRPYEWVEFKDVALEPKAGEMAEGGALPEGRTALHEAAREGHGELAGMLIDKGADVNATDGEGRTPLHYAAENGHVEMVKMLLSRKVDATKKDTQGHTPLDLAAKGGHRETAQALIEGGAQVGPAGELASTESSARGSSTRGAEGVHTATVTAEDMQRRGEEMLGRMAEACTYWLIRPPESVESYSYDFTLADGSPQHFEIGRAAGVGESRRQGITYYSPLHAIARDPKLARVGKIELTGNETIEIDFVLDEPFKQHFGTGVENTWRGYMSQPTSGGMIILDAKRFVPLFCRTADAEQTFSEYVEAGAGHYVPRRITVAERGREGMQWDWRFKLYEGGLWLFDQTGDKSPARAAASDVMVNGQPAREAAAAAVGMGAEAGQTDAVTRIVTEGRTKAEAVIRANRAWLVPSLEARKGLVYEYRQEEPYLEKVIFDENGNVMAELRSTKESPGKPTRQAFYGIDGTKVWASAEDKLVRTEKMAGPETATGEERMRCERVVSNLATGLGFESAITKMARGIDDYYADVADTAEKGRFTLLVTWPERGTSVFTGTMLTFSSWAYMHDVGCAKSEIVCDSATMRPIEEKDYDGGGKLVAAYTYADYLDDITGAAPGRITAVIPYEKDGKDNSLEMDARFGFAQPGLWLLKSVTSKFRGSAEGSTGRVTVVPATAESTAPMVMMLRRIKATNDLIRRVDEEGKGKVEVPFDTEAPSRIAVRAAWPIETRDGEEAEKAIMAAVSIRSAKDGIDAVSSTVSILSTAYWKEYEVEVTVEYLSETEEVLGTGTSTAKIRTEGAPRVTDVAIGETAVTGGPVTGGADAVKRVAVTAVAQRMTAMYHGHGRWMTFVEPAKKKEGKETGEAAGSSK